MQKQTGKKENVQSDTSNKSNQIHNNDLNSPEPLNDEIKHHQGFTGGTMNLKERQQAINNNLINRTKIEGTPFTMITQIMDNDKTKSFIVMGDHRLTEPTNTEEESLQKLITENWLVITNLIAIITEKMLEQQKIQEEKKEENFRNYMKTPGADLYDENKIYETESL